MRDGVLATALLSAALGLGLSFAPRRAWARGVVGLVATAFCVSAASIPRGWLEGLFFGCWASVVVTAVSVHFSRRLSVGAGLALSVNGGFWCGGIIALTGSPTDLIKALPTVLLLIPGAWLLRHQATIIVKVIASWLIAVAVLAATLQLLPVTPGYLPDHIE